MRSVATSDGRSVSVYEGGDPAGFPVLSIPGTPGSGLILEPLARDAAERGIRLFSYDRPGYGDSTRQEGRNVADCATDIEAVCDALGVERFCVWGVSGGGPYALAAAALLPDRVIAAATLASLAPFESWDEESVGLYRTWEGEDGFRAATEQRRREGLSVTPEQLVELWQAELGPADREVATHALAAYVLDSSRVAIGASADGWVDERVAHSTPWGFDLDTICVPVQVWHGKEDKSVPYEQAVWLAAHIPGADLHLTPEDGHYSIIVRGVPEVHRWLLEQTAPSTTAPRA